MEPWTIGRVAFAPFRWATGNFNRWTKRRGADRLALMRAGSEALTPMMELARMVGPAGIMWGDRNEIDQRFFGWADDWERMRTVLLTYANAHPSDDVRELTGEVVAAIGTSLSATRYLFLSLNTAGMGDGMDNFHNAEQRQREALALAERLLQKIRDY
jgi:hypothetical protein